MAFKLGSIFRNNNFLSLTNNSLIAVFGFLSFLLLVRQLSQDVFGEWVIFITMGGFVDMLRFGITRTAIIRFLSGADETQAKQLIGSNNFINLVTTCILSIIILLVYLPFKDTIDDSGFGLFFKWYPLLSFFSLTFNNAQSIQQAVMRFDIMLWLRLVNVGSFMIFLAVNMHFRFGIEIILWVYMITNLASSIIASLFNWDGIRYTFMAKRETHKLILNFGKYTTGTLIGSNLLRSSDTFIIGLSPFLGTTGVALYSIPLKLTEIIEIPLRSYTATAFPEMSKASIENNKSLVKSIFYLNSGGLSMLLIPIMLFCFIFAEEAVVLLGGQAYIETASVFRIFCFYGLLLPLDRFLGVALDSINKPRQNFFKVVYMATANIIGDILVVFGFSLILMGFTISDILSNLHDINVLGGMITPEILIATLEWVAIVTIIFTLIGIGVGYYFLNKELQLEARLILKGGKEFINKIVKVLYHH